MKFSELELAEQIRMIDEIKRIRASYKSQLQEAVEAVNEDSSPLKSSYWGARISESKLKRLRESDYRAYCEWSDVEDDLLLGLVENELTWEVIGHVLGRSANGVRTHFKFLQESSTEVGHSNHEPENSNAQQSRYSAHDDRGKSSLNKYGMVNPPPTGTAYNKGY